MVYGFVSSQTTDDILSPVDRLILCVVKISLTLLLFGPRTEVASA